jgi:predicted ATP-grasp superfamily ATP-dependent carboligase
MLDKGAERQGRESGVMLYFVTDRRVWRDYLSIVDDSFTVVRYSPQKGWMPFTPLSDDVVFCFTTRKCPQDVGKIINKNRGIVNANDKGLSRRILQQNGIPVPMTWFNQQDAVMPFIARPQRHSLVRDFYIVRKESDKQRFRATDGWYFSEVLDVKKEYRVIVGGQSVLASFVKPMGKSLEETIQRRKQEFANRSRVDRYQQSGTGVPRKQEPIPEEYAKICVDAASIIGLDFCGIDLMITNDGAYVCELNSAPTIWPFFATAIKAYIHGEHILWQSEKRCVARSEEDIVLC